MVWTSQTFWSLYLYCSEQMNPLSKIATLSFQQILDENIGGQDKTMMKKDETPLRYYKCNYGNDHSLSEVTGVRIQKAEVSLESSQVTSSSGMVVVA